MKILLIFLLFLAGCAAPNDYYKTQAKIKEQKIMRREKAIIANPAWPEDIKSLVLKGQIRPGMTGDQIVASWGYPIDTKKTVSTGTVSEQWFYGTKIYQYGSFIPKYTHCLFLINNKLISYTEL